MEQRKRFLGLATGTFFLGFALAFWILQQFHSPLFLPMLFWALAGAAHFGTMGPFRLRRRLIALFCVIFFGGLGGPLSARGLFFPRDTRSRWDLSHWGSNRTHAPDYTFRGKHPRGNRDDISAATARVPTTAKQ